MKNTGKTKYKIHVYIPGGVGAYDVFCLILAFCSWPAKIDFAATTAYNAYEIFFKVNSLSDLAEFQRQFKHLCRQSDIKFIERWDDSPLKHGL